MEWSSPLPPLVQKLPPLLACCCCYYEKSCRQVARWTKVVICAPCLVVLPTRDDESSPDGRRRNSAQWVCVDRCRAGRGSWQRGRQDLLVRYCDVGSLVDLGLRKHLYRKSSLRELARYHCPGFEELRRCLDVQPAAFANAMVKKDVRSDEDGSHAPRMVLSARQMEVQQPRIPQGRLDVRESVQRSLEADEKKRALLRRQLLV